MKKSNISGERIKKIRKAQNLWQADIAAALALEHDIKLDRSDISEIERGVRGVKDYELAAIAAILDVDPKTLLYGDE